MLQITSVLEGVALATNYKVGQTLVDDKDFQEHENFFQRLFEVARRHKIMNPEKMRGEYGKLAYLLQDAVSPALKGHLDFNIAAEGSLSIRADTIRRRQGTASTD